MAEEKKKPYGDVTYADPGYRDNKKRYPIDTEAHVRAAWSYINQKGNAAKYTSSQLAAIKGRIRSAAKRFGIKIAEAKATNEILSYLTPVRQFGELTLDAEGLLWVQAFPYDTWEHPVYGSTTVDRDKAEAFRKNFDEGVRGVEIATDYEHGLDPAKGGKASGWVRKIDVRDDGVYYGIEPTSTAMEEISNGEWKYFSGEFYESWTREPGGQSFENVVSGGGFTNKPYVKGMVPLNFSELVVEKEDVVDPTNEVVEKGHSEPGTKGPGGEPEPRETGEHEKGEQGTRGSDPTPPDAMPADLDARLREVLNLAPDADIVKAVEGIKAEVTPFREAAKQHSERKSFAEQYPEQARKLADLESTDRANRAKSFSERYANFVIDKDGQSFTTGQGFSGLAVTKIEELHKKFSEGTATMSDVAGVLDAISAGGIVDYKEVGTSRVRGGSELVGADPGQQFAEKVVEIQNQDSLSYQDATTEAINRYPDLYEAYRESVEPARRA